MIGAEIDAEMEGLIPEQRGAPQPLPMRAAGPGHQVWRFLRGPFPDTSAPRRSSPHTFTAGNAAWAIKLRTRLRRSRYAGYAPGAGISRGNARVSVSPMSQSVQQYPTSMASRCGSRRGITVATIMGPFLQFGQKRIGSPVWTWAGSDICDPQGTSRPRSSQGVRGSIGAVRMSVFRHRPRIECAGWNAVPRVSEKWIACVGYLTLYKTSPPRSRGTLINPRPPASDYREDDLCQKPQPSCHRGECRCHVSEFEERLSH